MRDPLGWIPLKFKLPLTFLLMGLVVYGLSALIVTATAKDALEQAVTREVTELAWAQARSVEQQLSLLVRRAEDFASDGYIRDAAQRLADVAQPDSAEARDTRERLVEHLAKNKVPLELAFANIHIVHTQRGTLASADVPAAPPWSKGEQAAATSTVVGPLQPPGEGYDFAHFAVATTLLNLERTEQIGTLVVTVHAENWLDEVTLLGERGDKPLFHAYLSAPSEVTLPMTGAGAAPPSRLQANGMTFALPVAATDWHVEVVANPDVALASLTRFVEPLLVTAALALLVVGGLLMVVMQFVLRPLSSLGHAARQIGEGDFDVEVPLEQQDEIGDLSRAFNVMAAAVEERSRKLEDSALALRREEQEVRQQRDRLQAIIGSMEDGLFILKNDGSVSLANRPAEAVLIELDKPAETLKLRCLKRAEQGQSCRECLANWFKRGEPCVVQVEGRIYEVTVTALSTTPNATGKGERVFVSRDITERVRQNEVQAHQERMAVVGRMAAVVAHELNNPLAAIAMFAQMLEEQLPEESQWREYAGVIRRNTEACAASIRSLMESSTHAPPEVERFDLHELAHDLIEFLEPLARRAGVTLRLDLKAREPWIEAEPQQIRQVLTNLLVNAIQAGEASELPAVTVTLSSHDGKETLQLDVCDTGPGIAEQERDNIFKPFYSTKPPGIGTGLGLPTSRQVVVAHGGRLDLVETKPGLTRFRIELPREVRHSNILRPIAPSNPA